MELISVWAFPMWLSCSPKAMWSGTEVAGFYAIDENAHHWYGWHSVTLCTVVEMQFNPQGLLDNLEAPKKLWSMSMTTSPKNGKWQPFLFASIPPSLQRFTFILWSIATILTFQGDKSLGLQHHRSLCTKRKTKQGCKGSQKFRRKCVWSSEE